MSDTVCTVSLLQGLLFLITLVVLTVFDCYCFTVLIFRQQKPHCCSEVQTEHRDQHGEQQGEQLSMQKKLITVSLTDVKLGCDLQ